MFKSIRMPILLIAAIPFYFYLAVWIISQGSLFLPVTYLVSILFLIIAILLSIKNKMMNITGVILATIISLFWIYLGAHNDKFPQLETSIGIFFIIFYPALYLWQQKLTSKQNSTNKG